MFLGRAAPFYQLFVVASTLIQIICNQCIPETQCDIHYKCCPELTRHAASTFPANVELVGENAETITTQPTTVQKANFPLRVNTTIISCGRRMLDNNKIVGGSETKFGEFPWMAVLFYRKYNHNECAGSIIHPLFILTAAHCLVGRVLFVMGKPYKVRLGEYDLTTDPDCITNQFCAPNAVDIPVLNTFPHPNYYIQPICYDHDGEWFYVAGWGKTEKLKKVIDCEKDDQICAGGHHGIDSCAGDSGAPLMLLKGSTWSVVGIVSKGQRFCGTDNYPALYTRVDVHLKWLQRKMLSA